MSVLPPVEPGEPEIPPGEPPVKMEFSTAAYGWLRHVDMEIENLQNYLDHIRQTFEQALRDLEVHIPEELRESALDRATSRRSAMIQNPLPAFPEFPWEDGIGGIPAPDMPSS
jgi:hypothetical protein